MLLRMNYANKALSELHNDCLCVKLTVNLQLKAKSLDVENNMEFLTRRELTV